MSSLEIVGVRLEFQVEYTYIDTPEIPEELLNTNNNIYGTKKLYNWLIFDFFRPSGTDFMPRKLNDSSSLHVICQSCTNQFLWSDKNYQK